MHGYGPILGNSKTVFESPFFKPVDSMLQFPLDSIDSRFVHNNKVIHTERTFNTRVNLLHNVIDFNIE